MNQSSAIAGSLVIAFIVFITVRGELPCYMEVLGISSKGQCQKAVSGLIKAGDIVSGLPGGSPVSVSLPTITV